MTMERLKKCKWISKNTGENSLMLRKVFEIPSEIEKASLYCSGLGQAVYFLNGKRVSDNVYIRHRYTSIFPFVLLMIYLS